MGMFSDIDYSLIVLQLEKAMANGVATLNSSAKVPTNQISLTASDVGAIASTGNGVLTTLNAASGTISASVLPSYVDDVLNFANLAAFPVAGDAGKIYVTEDNNKVYRWSGSVYVEISSSATAGEALKLTNARTISTTGDITGSISGFDGSADVSGVMTLQTVNSNVGSFGSVSAIPVVTVNAKGQVTAVSTNSIGNELIAIQALGDTAGFLRKTGDGTYSIDVNSYLPLSGGTVTGNLSITGSLRGTGTGVWLFESSPLGTVAGNTQLLSTKTGLVHNVASERTWIRRRVAGTNWETALFHNGITVDTAFQTPGVDTRAWWERDIQTGSQSWGNGNTTFFSADSSRFNIPLTTPSTSTTTGASVVGGGQGIGGNQHIGGFTSLGGDASHPAVKFMELSGTTAASQGGMALIAHGLNSAKIKAINVLVSNIPSNYVTPGLVSTAGYQFDVAIDVTQILITNIAANSYSILNKPIVVTVFYIA